MSKHFCDYKKPLILIDAILNYKFLKLSLYYLILLEFCYIIDNIT